MSKACDPLANPHCVLYMLCGTQAPPYGALLVLWVGEGVGGLVWPPLYSFNCHNMKQALCPVRYWCYGRVPLLNASLLV